MKANEFVKMFGIEKTSSELSLFQSRLVMWSDWEFVEELKRLVASHELVDSLGGMDSCRSMVQLSGHEYLKKSIADVESCQ